MSDSVYQFGIGQFDCMVIQDFSAPSPISQFVSNASEEEVKQLARQQGYTSDDIDFSVNILLVKSFNHLVLIDTGIGQSSLPDKLKRQGVDPVAIDTVVISHGHRDHVGGIVDEAGNFLYPNARYVMSRVEYNYWLAPEQVEQADKNPAVGVIQTLQANQAKLTLLDNVRKEVEIVPGLCAIDAPGHTLGHLAVSVESGIDRLLHIMDSAHIPLQVIRSEWSPSFDYDKTLSADTRLKLFKRAEWTKALTMTYHFPFPGLGYITADNDTLHWTPVKA